MTLNELFKNTNYDDTLFSAEAKQAIESALYLRTGKVGEIPYINCLQRNKGIKLTPEEAVRQLYLYKLIHEYLNPASRRITARWVLGVWMPYEILHHRRCSWLLYGIS